MLDRPHIVQTEAQPAAVIRLTIPRAEIQTVMGPAIAEVLAAVAAQGLAPTGPVFSHHLRMDPETFDFEVGVPVKTPITSTGRVHASQLPAATVARTVYRGPYEGLGSAWCEFGEWIATEGHKPAANLWECYAAGPESNADPATWRTQLNRPLTG
jgi:effector-binding domain-containing protein